MPVQANIAIGTTSLIAWDGATSREMDIRKHIRFAWTMEVIADIVTDAVFTIQSAMPNTADPTIPGPWTNVDIVPLCNNPGQVGPAQIVMPAGTLAGTLCGGTIACRPGAFVRVIATSGDTANVLIVGVLQGPKV